MKSLILQRRRRVLWGTVMAACLLTSSLTLVSSPDAGNPVPYVYQPLVPDAVAPGGPGFTLTVNGTGFVSGSVVNWNGSARATQFVSEGQLTASILTTDIARAGTASITVVNPRPGGGTSGTVFLPVATPEASVPLARTDFSSAGGNIFVVTADFNGDGTLDLATTEYYDNLVRIFLGNGDGTFRIGQIYTACQPHGLATGDFNGDGIVDLAVGARGCGEVTIFLGNGDGTFRESGSFPVGPGGPYGAPYSIAVGDFNGDGKLDLVTAKESNVVSVLLGNGDGTFQSPVDYATVPDSIIVATGDFNGDGRLDLAVSSWYNAVSVLLGNGDGTFQPQSQYQLDDNSPSYVIVADLNRDGMLDLALANNGGWVFLLLGNGDGTFHTGGKYATGGFSASVTAADFNGDGILDLATANYYSSSISLLLGNGDGTFRAPVKYPAGYGARGMAVGDFNGDGRLDLAVGNQFVDSISIFLQTTGAPVVSLSPTSVPFQVLRTVGTTSLTQTVKLTNVGSAQLDVTGITLTGPDPGDFAQSNNCPPSVASGASCLITVTFTPRAQGVRTASVSITDNAPGSPQTVPLTGRGTFFEWAPRQMFMGDQPVGTSSPAQTVTLTNAGTTPITLYSIGMGGVNPGDFTQTNSCGSGLNPGASCTIEVTFTPTATGGRIAHVAIHDSAFGGTHWVGLLGNGVGGHGVCTPPPSGMTDWWPGDGNPNDLLGRYNGVIQGGLTFTPGEVVKAFTFNGVDAAVKFGPAGDFATSDFTVDFWLRSAPSVHEEGVLEKRASCSHGQFYGIRMDDTRVGHLEVEVDDGKGDYVDITTSRAINDGGFHLIALVRQGTTVSVYIDGTRDSTATTGAVANVSNSALLTAGQSICDGVDGTVPFIGKIDEIEVFTRALAASEIQAIYEAGSAGKCKKTRSASQPRKGSN